MGELKPGWRRVALGDVVQVVTDYWDRDPSIPHRFVAGEHIDEGSLRIRRWGLTSDTLVPPTFNRRFLAGDVLFHSRNLRKLACPDFDGITGEKLFVLRSKDPTQLLPTLLPFLLQTEEFDEYVNRMWAGSTNKFLNKAPLVRFEFVLPPLEQQRRIVEAARASALVRESLRDAEATTVALVDAFCTHLITSIAPEAQMEVGKVAKFTSGKSIPVTTLPQIQTDVDSVPVYGGNGIAGYTSKPLTGVPVPTVVIGRVGQFCGVTCLTIGQAWITDNALYPVSIDECIDMAFLSLVLRGRQLNRGKLGEYLPLITQKVVHATLIPVPDRGTQRRAVDAVREIEDSLQRTRTRLREADIFYQRLLETLTNRTVDSHVVY